MGDLARTWPARFTFGPVTLSAERVLAYRHLTEDDNPIHLDPRFAAGTRFGAPIVYGTLTLVVLWDAIDAALGGAVLETSAVEVRFVRPVPVGATVEGRAEREPTDDGRPAYTLVVLTDGVPVIEGRLLPAGASVPPPVSR